MKWNGQFAVWEVYPVCGVRLYGFVFVSVGEYRVYRKKCRIWTVFGGGRFVTSPPVGDNFCTHTRIELLLLPTREQISRVIIIPSYPCHPPVKDDPPGIGWPDDGINLGGGRFVTSPPKTDFQYGCSQISVKPAFRSFGPCRTPKRINGVDLHSNHRFKKDSVRVSVSTSHSQKFASFFWSKKVFCQFLLCYRKFGWIRLWISVSRVLHFQWGWRRDISQLMKSHNNFLDCHCFWPAGTQSIFHRPQGTI